MIFKTKLLVFFNLLQFIIFVKSDNKFVRLQFKINHLDNVNYKNIRIECQSDNTHLNISFIPSSTATNIYFGEACHQDKYKLVIADQKNNVNLKFKLTKYCTNSCLIIQIKISKFWVLYGYIPPPSPYFGSQSFT